MTDDLKVGLKVTADTAEANAELKNTEQSVKGLGTGGKEATAGLNDAGAAAKKTAADTGKLDSSAGGATRELKQTGAAAQTTSADVNKLGTSGDKAAAGLKHVGTSAEESGKKTEHSVSVYRELRRGLVELAAASIGIEAAKGLTELADEAQNAAAKIRLTTSSEEEFEQIQKKLLDLSQQTRTSYADNVQFYQRLYNATKNLTDAQGKQLFNTTDLIQVQTTLNQALQLSGATSTEATNGLIQLSQGLASGVLRGQDLRAVLDDIPGVATKAQTAASLELATSQQATTATTLEAAQATKTAALAKTQAAEAAALLAKTNAEVAAAATAVAAAEVELAVAQKAEAIAQTQATVAAKEYQTVVKSGIVSTKLLANGVGGLVSGLVNLAIAYEAGNAVGTLLYDNFEFVRKGANDLAEGVLLLHAELFGTADDIKKIEENFASAVTSTEKFGDAAEKAGAKSAGAS